MNKLITWIAISYLWAVILYLIGRQLVEGWHPIITLINCFIPFLFLPLLIIIPYAFWIRSKILLASMLPLVGCFIYLYGALFWPLVPTGAPEPSADDLALMTFNLGPGQSTPEYVAQAIAQTSADIVAVQELTVPLAEQLRADLGTTYPYMLLDPESETTGLLSRYPIHHVQWYKSRDDVRAYLRAEIEWQDTLLQVWVFHPRPPRPAWVENTIIPLGLDDRVPQQQTRELAENVGTFDDPTIVMGDFNMTDQAPAYSELSNLLYDAHRQVGWGFGFTFPHLLFINRYMPWPMLRLDYIFYSGDFRALSSSVSCQADSDHCSMFAVLERMP